MCDAGGGTVDLISYEVVRLPDRRSGADLQLKEVTEGTGVMSGSSMLTGRFRRFLLHKHGSSYWTDDRLAEVLVQFEKVSTVIRPPLSPRPLLSIYMEDDGTSGAGLTPPSYPSTRKAGTRRPSPLFCAWTRACSCRETASPCRARTWRASSTPS